MLNCLQNLIFEDKAHRPGIGVRTTVKGLFSITLAAFVLASPALAAADQPPPADSRSGAVCELHLWPGNGFHAVYYGWAHGGTVDGALKGRTGYTPMPSDPLSVEQQRDALRRLPIAQWLGLPEFLTVVHDEALSSREIRSSTMRHAGTGLPCYAELMIDDLVVQHNVLSGKALNVLFRFRRFDDGEAPSRSYGTFIQQPLRLFPPAKPDDDPQPALDELASAFDMSLKEFGAAVQKPGKMPRKNTKQ